MSRADKIFIENLKDIIENGFSDENLEVLWTLYTTI